jgi:hypothetical protein
MRTQERRGWFRFAVRGGWFGSVYGTRDVTALQSELPVKRVSRSRWPRRRSRPWLHRRHGQVQIASPAIMAADARPSTTLACALVVKLTLLRSRRIKLAT